ncbi:MAG: hypothetical protein H6677_07590 [Candidatus Obscuribacterales bacterium]|nr:hypothetical protein [Candidatus Obscuribacterales bacterium]
MNEDRNRANTGTGAFILKALGIVLIFIFLINTVVLLFVYNKIEGMEQGSGSSVQQDMDDLNRSGSKDLKRLQKQFEALEKADTANDTRQK